MLKIVNIKDSTEKVHQLKAGCNLVRIFMIKIFGRLEAI